MLVTLESVPVEIRLEVASELAKSWRLRGIDYALWMLRAQSPESHPPLKVDAAKLELVMSGRRPPGPVPRELLASPWNPDLEREKPKRERA